MADEETLETAQEDNAGEEMQTIKVSAPYALDDETFRMFIIQDLLENNQDYLQQVAKENKLDLQKDIEQVSDLAFTEQANLIGASCLDSVLNEKTAEAYNMLNKACYFSDMDMLYIQHAEGENANSQLPEYIEKRLENVTMLAPVLQLTKNVNQALLYSIGDYPNFNMYEANLLAEKFENCGLALEPEQEGKLYFIASKMYRKLGGKANVYADLKAGAEEQECLRRVLALCPDYKLISYCQNRMERQGQEKAVARAYQNALSKASDRKDLFRINSALADIYARRSCKVGFAAPNSDKVSSADKALRYLTGAYRYAEQKDRLQVLRKMADVQIDAGRIEEWKNVKTVIALRFLKKEERCQALNAIGDKTGDASYYARAAEECLKTRMPQEMRLNLLETTYRKMAEQRFDPEMREQAAVKWAEVKTQRQEMYDKLLFGKKGKGRL